MILVNFPLSWQKHGLVRSRRLDLVSIETRARMNTPSRVEVRSMIPFHHLKGLKPKEIYNEVISVYEEVISFSMVVRWCREFENGRSETEDLQRAARPRSSITDEIVSDVKKLILENRGIKLMEISKILDISYGSV